MLYTDWKSVPPDLLTSIDVIPRRIGKRVGSHRRKYLNIVSAFDIETTALNEHESIMYIWQLQIGLHDTIIGRTWDDYLSCVHMLTAELPDDIYLVCYIHNAAFEFQFLRGVYPFEQEEVFAIDSRRPLRFDMFHHIEYRCSYIHTNMRLETYLDKMGVENQKLKYDYEKKRYPWTPLTDQELEYCINDVKGLVQAIYKEMAMDGDDLYSIPPTSTGYVRRDVKAAMRRVKYGWIREQLPDFDTYNLLREAFRGGNTHANRYYVKQILTGVHSVDMISAYPAAQLLDRFPIGPFRAARYMTWEELNDLRYRRKKALLIRVSFTNIRLKDQYDGCPYLAVSKCRKLSSSAQDNGRILHAAYLETTLTDIDLEIIEEQYNWEESVIVYMEHSRYGLLPDILKYTIMTYFRDKTLLDKTDLLREKQKNKLNAIYGMSATNPVKDNIIYKDGHFEPEGLDLMDLLDRSNRKAFYPYQWGIWTTAIVRRRLHYGIREVERQGGEFVYCDTDSIKYIGNVDLEPINKPIREAAQAGGYYADDKTGTRHYVGVFEDEGIYQEFVTRGAKKYAYRKDGHIKAVIAGVPAREDGDHISGGMIVEKAGGMAAMLRDSLIFDNKLKLIYNDDVNRIEIIEGREIRITSCVTLSSTTYELSDTLYYDSILEAMARGKELPLMLSKAALREYRRDILGKK